MSILNLDTLNEDKPAQTEEKIISDENREQSETELPIETGNEPNPEQQTVIMDGPLSKIYTQALNLVYAKEASAASGAAGQTDVKLVFDEDIEKATDYHDALYVYCCDASSMDSNEAVKASDKLRLALDNKNIKKTYVVMESHRLVKPAAGLLEEMAVKLGIPVIFKRDIAIEAICDAIRA